ncbi:MAG: TauD/TfdA family dioxygenase [Gammaproteobacteria bacterium]|nr:TauD/TfdA family dioxygenase [Gammaproteobacteria bacterium]MBT8151527.1 TauD/TfdA family dioxygenase [Gammaproteobacteria bacterium]NND40211.1 TauD/TfdA family dioxygenase [Pseudomonadales bacterium]NNM12220.1 TauD/TfdA family dioxygenase [Pseudomonadales bacterium]RZV57194.1 MAG: TauD/TfdA family dioxygenase [Pseudomonadales bacterium]
MTLQTKPLDNVGVEVLGFNINQPYTDALKEELRTLFYEHGIVVFRNQDITPENQIRFSAVFGPLEMHPLKTTTNTENPELFELENGGDKDKLYTAFYKGEEIVGRLDWHMDLHYTAKPNQGAVLTAVEVPGEDGLTGFGDLAKAYDSLDNETKALLEKIEVAYAFCMQRRHMRYVDLEGYEPGPHSPLKPSDANFPDFADAAYPAVVTHPISGRKVLEIVEQFLDRIITPHQAALSNDEAIELLERLVAHTRKPEFHYWHEWLEGDMVLWDNWRGMHCTTGTKPGVRRRINRTTIMGDVMLGRVITKE